MNSASEPGFHHVDQARFPLSGATPVVTERGDVVLFSYLLVHGSYLNTSDDRVRRMFLIQGPNSTAFFPGMASITGLR